MVTVKDLKELLANVPDSFPVYIGTDGETFEWPDMEVSGISNAGPSCNEEGDEIETDEGGAEIFALLTAKFKEQ